MMRELNPHEADQTRDLRTQQLLAIAAATPHLSMAEQQILFTRIWDTARCVGAMQGRRSLELAGLQQLARRGLVPEDIDRVIDTLEAKASIKAAEAKAPDATKPDPLKGWN